MPKLKRFKDLSIRQQNRRLLALLQQDRLLLNELQNNQESLVSIKNHPNVEDYNEIKLETEVEDVVMLMGEQVESDIEVSVGLVETEQRAEVEQSRNSNELDVNGELETKPPLSQRLSSWAVQYKLPHNAVTSLLGILKDFGHSELPSNARTLLQTPRQTAIVQCVSGSYFHYGLEKALKDQLRYLNISRIPNDILIDLNIDGLPLSKSSKSQIWPILGKLFSPNSTVPFMIGAFHGNNKPSSPQELLECFITEYTLLHTRGFLYLNEVYTVTIRAVICDSPARSFVTCTKGHNAYFGCGNCIQEGEYRHHRILFLEDTAPCRTDEGFRNAGYEEHHTGKSPFEDLGIGMVTQFPLDYMHLVCLGVVKKMLGLWLRGYQTTRLSAAKIRQLSETLISMVQWVPVEFARKPRSLDEVDRWKATEYRLFLLYLGPVVLQQFLPKENILNFCTLQCAISILCHPTDCFRNNSYARQLITYFVQTFKVLYGEETIIYNVHNLIHLSDHSNRYGALDSFGAFPYENFMQSLKKMLKKAEKPLSQLHRRITEKVAVSHSIIRNSNQNSPTLLFPQKKQLAFGCTNSHSTIQFHDFKISTKGDADNCCYLKDGSVVLVQDIGFFEKDPIIICKKFANLSGLPNYPCDSQQLGIHLTWTYSDLQIVKIDEIEKKAVRLPFQNGFCILPLLHSST